MFDPEGKTIALPPHVSNGPPLRSHLPMKFILDDYKMETTNE